MTAQTFVIPEPPSLNNLFRNVPGKGRVKTDRYRAWLQEALWDVRIDGNKTRYIQTIMGPVEVAIALLCRGDLDNRAKPIIDLMVKAQVIGDDRQVIKVTITKDGVPKRALVTVLEVPFG